MRFAPRLTRAPELAAPRSPEDYQPVGTPSEPALPAQAGGLLVPSARGLRTPLAVERAAGPGGRPSWSILPLRFLSLRVLSFAALVAMPIAAASVYYFAVAADQYVAEFRFTLNSVDAPRFDPMSLFAGNPIQSPVALESQIVVQYITSRAIVDEIDATLDLRRFFSPPQADWWSGLTIPASIEALVRYWKGQVDPFYDPAYGSVTVRVRAFAPADALRLSEAIVASCEKLVNELSRRARRDGAQRAEAELAQAETRLKSVLGEIRAFRDREGMIDPARTAEATGLLATRLRDELIRANAERATLKRYMRDDAPSIKVLTARIKSLEAQRRILSDELTDPDKTRPDTLSRTLGAYEQLESTRKFAEAAYQLALRGVDQARATADRQHVFIASFIPPSLPEEAIYPRRWRSLGTLALLALAFWGIGGLAAQSVRDHLS